MPGSPKRPRLSLEGDFPSDSEDYVPPASWEESEPEEGSSSSSVHFVSSSSSSSNFSVPLTSSPSSAYSSSSSSSYYVDLSPSEEQAPFVASGGHPGVSPPLSPQSSISSSTLHEEGTADEDEDLSMFRYPYSPHTGYRQNAALEAKVADLAHVLMRKYQLQEPVSGAEMLQVISEGYKDQFPWIFGKAALCLQVLFGVDIRKRHAASSSYDLVKSLDLTYSDETLSDAQSLPRNGFLIALLGVIFIQGNCASEETIWEFLNMVGVYEGVEDLICGEPRKFLSNLVQQNYLEYRQVPGSDPARYEFLWGPRAQAETTKMKVLEFWAKAIGHDPAYFSEWYEEALRDEEERAQASVGPVDRRAAMFLAQHCTAAALPPSEESGVASAPSALEEDSRHSEVVEGQGQAAEDT